MADLLLLEAKDLAGKGEHLRACAALTKAKRLQPTNAEILIDLSLSLLHLNKVSKALQSADQAIQLDPVSHRAYYARALALIQLPRLEEAIRVLQQAKELGDGGDAERVMAETKWLLKSQHEEAGTECPTIAADATKPEEQEPELSAKDKMAFIRAQSKEVRQSKHARGQIASKGTGVAEVLNELTKDADSRADYVLRQLNGVSAGGGSIAAGDGGTELTRYSSERVQRFVEAEIVKMLGAQADPASKEQYARPVAILLPGKWYGVSGACFALSCACVCSAREGCELDWCLV